ncbi:MAG: hypothetical protein FWG98_00245 [Candidatus Cloacimonetes bacterium]|nr:hypothetical protein [Candidatus Cloacimonadota bacterium]
MNDIKDYDQMNKERIELFLFLIKEYESYDNRRSKSFKNFKDLLRKKNVSTSYFMLYYKRYKKTGDVLDLLPFMRSVKVKVLNPDFIEEYKKHVEIYDMIKEKRITTYKSCKDYLKSVDLEPYPFYMVYNLIKYGTFKPPNAYKKYKSNIPDDTLVQEILEARKKGLSQKKIYRFLKKKFLTDAPSHPKIKRTLLMHNLTKDPRKEYKPEFQELFDEYELVKAKKHQTYKTVVAFLDARNISSSYFHSICKKFNKNFDRIKSTYKDWNKELYDDYVKAAIELRMQAKNIKEIYFILKDRFKENAYSRDSLTRILIKHNLKNLSPSFKKKVFVALIDEYDRLIETFSEKSFVVDSFFVSNHLDRLIFMSVYNRFKLSQNEDDLLILYQPLKNVFKFENEIIELRKKQLCQKKIYYELKDRYTDDYPSERTIKKVLNYHKLNSSHKRPKLDVLRQYIKEYELAILGLNEKYKLVNDFFLDVNMSATYFKVLYIKFQPPEKRIKPVYRAVDPYIANQIIRLRKEGRSIKNISKELREIYPDNLPALSTIHRVCHKSDLGNLRLVKKYIENQNKENN